MYAQHYLSSERDIVIQSNKQQSEDYVQANVPIIESLNLDSAFYGTLRNSLRHNKGMMVQPTNSLRSVAASGPERFNLDCRE
ncbi:hypothetical protein KIN20_019508 [Parelaphostrongylus tenuis]|uniref:Uncharacterized protein n=1 Tax=Parelaphostrongylus tenuis TaxID=148309 RepID=A0AAD5N2A4_PARTN|nr:hypothetical protein KIN20_019508 [Parelaphostrongylus tenuis]